MRQLSWQFPFGLLMLVCSALISSCSSLNYPLRNNETIWLTGYATDTLYGWSAQAPIYIGGSTPPSFGRFGVSGGLEEQSFIALKRYFNALAGPNGEPITIRRTGSTDGGECGMTDIYELLWQGNSGGRFLHVNLYCESEMLLCPAGLSIRDSVRPK